MLWKDEKIIKLTKMELYTFKFAGYKNSMNPMLVFGNDRKIF